jgi:beta-glucuronidase
MSNYLNLSDGKIIQNKLFSLSGIAVLILFLFVNTGFVFAGEDLMVNAYNRPFQSLNGNWKYIVDPYENGFYNYRYEAFDKAVNPAASAYFTNSKPRDKTDLIEYDFDKSEELSVPGDWNSQKEKLFYYEGTVWYKKSFDYLRKKDSGRVFVYFGAVNYQSDIYLNGKKLGTNTGGFTPFMFEITKLLKDKDNFLVLKVDNKRKKEGVPTLNTDWWNYGGITRDVKLIETPASFIRDFFIQLNPEKKDLLEGYVKLDGQDIKNKKVTLKIPQTGFEKTLTTDDRGIARLRTEIKNLTYWSPEKPFRYRVILQTDEDRISDQIGFRTIKTRGKDILLNDKKIFLRGISIHEENPLRGGRAHSLEDARRLLNWARELGCNFVRLAHYPHNEHMIRLADEMGLMVWEEIPVYWTIDWKNPETLSNAKDQLTSVITRDKNRAAVIIWSMANETPVSEPRNRFLSELAGQTRRMDPTRLISAALEQKDYQGNSSVRTIDDPFAEQVDVLSFNQYIGWYDGLPEKARTIQWKITQNKPVLISEFGAGAKYGFHADKDTRWSEEYQEYLYRETLKMISGIDQLQGFSPWILADFRSPRRHLPEIQDGWNRKGLISEKGEKKKAFFVLRDFYNKKASPEELKSR